MSFLDSSAGHARLETAGALTGAFGRRLGLLALVLAAVPPVLIVIAILNAGTPPPFEDQWEMVPLLERDAAGTLTLADLWAQQNEHRYVIPWIVMLALARLTRWDLLAELMLNVVLSLAALALLAWLARRTCRAAPGLVPWIVLGASLMTFSMVKWQNWLRSLSQPAFVSALAACVTVVALARYGPTVTGALLAITGAIAGALSFANGLVLLAIVPVGLVLDPRAPAARRRRLALIASAVAAAVIAVYLRGLEHPAAHPDPWLFLRHPIDFLLYVLAYLGAPLGWPGIAASIVWGVVGVLVLSVATAWLWSRPASPGSDAGPDMRPDARQDARLDAGLDPRPDALPWLMLAGYVVGSAAMAAVGRLGAGVPQALASRYTTISTFVWVSVAALAAQAIVSVLGTTTVSARIRTATVAIAVVIVVSASAGYARSWVETNRWVESIESINVWALECLRFYRQAPDGCLGLMHADPAVVRERAQRLERLALGPFAHRPRLPATLASYRPVEAHDTAGAITAAWQRPIDVEIVGGKQDRYVSTEVGLAGWARDPRTGRPPARVLIGAGGAVLGEASLTGSGTAWSFTFGVFRLPPGARTLEAFAVLDGLDVARLEGSRPLPAERGP